MMSSNRKLPIGIQDFEDLRTNGYLYVDKTAYIYQLATTGKPYFLGRPRRFGKSLFLSTLKAYFLGKKELFDGLAISGLEKKWVKYPVIYIDFNKAVYTDVKTLHVVLDNILQKYEAEWQITNIAERLSVRFDNLIQEMYNKTGCKAVVLVDEYDKPLLGTMDNLEVNDEIRTVLKGFYGVLKSSDAFLRFVFLTGVTKFSKVSVFSDLNQLQDISMKKQYAGICGITQTELIKNFRPEITALAEKQKLTYEETLAELKKHYDGYHFAKESDDIYNPFSVLNTFSDSDFNNYWFETGTPTFLIKMLKDIDFNLKSLENDVQIPADLITDYQAGSGNPVPLLYQSGYLTVKKYDKEFNEYTLGFPNNEVKYGFIKRLIPAYMSGREMSGDFSTGNFIRDLRAGNTDGFMTRLQSFFSSIPYELNNKEEKHYQTVFYLLFKLMGQFVQTEVSSAVGRADAVVVVDDAVYIFEFKLTGNATAEEALKQIDERKYAAGYAVGGKKIVKVGAEFNAEERTLHRWCVENGRTF
ncbi:MAG: ATP-binding protein [Candidatus Azobacteroides sp.]|nr:ATP-binding protein [Candidatus Azobacteroides sp.]